MAKKITKNESDTLAFAKAINKLVQKQDEFAKIIEEMKTLKADTLTSIQLELKAKRNELDSLDKEYEVKLKDLQIKVDQDFKEHGYNKAVEVLEEHGEIAVNEETYNELKDSVDVLKKEAEEELEKKLKELKSQHARELAGTLKNKELEHKAEIAMLTAKVEQLTKERQTFESTIKNLQSEIAAQRDLTRQVAEASKQGAISQNFGK